MSGQTNTERAHEHAFAAESLTPRDPGCQAHATLAAAYAALAVAEQLAKFEAVAVDGRPA